MFRDTEKELKRLEEELLEAEEAIPTDTDELLAQLHQELDEEPAIDPELVYNTDRVDTDVEEFGQEVAETRKEKLTGLVVAALLLTAGILGLLVWWMLRLLG